MVSLLLLHQYTLTWPRKRELKKALSNSHSALIMTSGPQFGSHAASRSRASALQMPGIGCCWIKNDVNV